MGSVWQSSLVVPCRSFSFVLYKLHLECDTKSNAFVAYLYNIDLYAKFQCLAIFPPPKRFVMR